MGFKIEVLTKDGVDFAKRGLITNQPVRVYNIADETLTNLDLEKIKGILVDPATDAAAVNMPVVPLLPFQTVVIEQGPKPGVMDPEGINVQRTIQRIIGKQVGPVSSGRQYFFVGELPNSEYEKLIKRLGNSSPLTTQSHRIDSRQSSNPLKRFWHWIQGVEENPGIPFNYPTVNLSKPPAFQYIDLNVPDDKLVRISDERYLALNLGEMQTIRDLFIISKKNSEYLNEREKKGLKAIPTDAEVEGLAQTWSEHCYHKKINALWRYTSEDVYDESGLLEEIDSIFKSVIKASTRQIYQDRNLSWLVSVYNDNAGVISLNSRRNVAHKVETHNHPSGLAGHGGANTGTGGVIRDPFGTGIGMRPVSSQWVFGVPTPWEYIDLPEEIQTPARCLQTIVGGVEDYGNKFGIPTMCGGVFVDLGFLKPMVGVGCVAEQEKEINGRLTHVKKIEPGYIAVSIGGRVGKDGIHGATGSSIDQKAGAEQNQKVNQSVQIGNPITEKCMVELGLTLAKLGLVEASQDCGAGGWNSAVGELASLLDEMEQTIYQVQQHYQHRGISSQVSAEQRMQIASEVVDFGEKVYNPFLHTLEDMIVNGEVFFRQTTGRGGVVMDLTYALEKYLGLTGWEKVVSEAQERQVLVIKKENLKRVQELGEHFNVEVTPIAEFNGSGYYEVRDQDQTIMFLPTEFLHRALPQMKINAHWKPTTQQEPVLEERVDFTQEFLEMLGRPNMQNYHWIRTRFDHEVRGGSLVKPIVGKGRGTSDAIAYHPVLGESQVVIESIGHNPLQGVIDGYHMGVNAVTDAIGKIIATGGSLEKICFNGNTMCAKPEDDPSVAAGVLRMLKGSADAEIAYGTPRISGKDSTSMEKEYISTQTRERVRVKAKSEILMSGLGVVKDDSTLTTLDFKKSGDLIYVVGETRDELGGSEYYAMHNTSGRNVPRTDLKQMPKRYQAMDSAIAQGLVHSAKYIERGGLPAALKESSIAGQLGATVFIDEIQEGLSIRKTLFSESTGRFLLSIDSKNQARFEEVMQGQYCQRIGKVGYDEQFTIISGASIPINTTISEMRQANDGRIQF